MFKFLTIIILSLSFFQTAKAQKQDTLLYYIRNNGALVSDRDSADYFRLVIGPDSSSGEKLYAVREYYPSGKIKMMGSSANSGKNLAMRGSCVQFYGNGNRHSIVNYNANGVDGDMIFYYPNGKIYCVMNYGRSSLIQSKMDLIQCQDSTGNIIAKDGNGHWLRFDDDCKKLLEQGDIKDKKETGEWEGAFGDTVNFTCTYKEGKIISGTAVGKSGKQYHFTEKEISPAFNGGYLNFIVQHLKYPAVDRENNIQGKVIVTFLVGKDGKLSNFKVLRTPSKTLGDEAIRVISLSSPWKPGLYYGIPISSQFTVPISFALGGNE